MVTSRLDQALSQPASLLLFACTIPRRRTSALREINIRRAIGAKARHPGELTNLNA
jgi:hypothetical protein